MRSASTFYQSTPLLSCIHTCISSFWNTLNRNLCFSNSAGISGQHDIVVLMYPPQNQKRIFLSEVRFELTNVCPPPKSEKNFLSKVKFELTNVPPPPRKVGFCLFRTFPIFPPKWLIMTWNTQFCPIHNFPIFSHQSGPE